MTENKKEFVFLETTRPDKENRHSFLFTEPVAVVTASDYGEIKPCFEKIEKFIEQGYFAAGFASYEAGYAFEKIAGRPKNFDFPLLWFGIFEKPEVFDCRENKVDEKILFKSRGLLHRSPRRPPRNDRGFKISNQRFNVSAANYCCKIERIKKFIEAGHTYQVNFTLKNKFNFAGSPFRLYFDLKEKQKTAYSALIKFGAYFILSFSPELFFKLKGRKMAVRPMKGTMGRGRFLAEDEKFREHLKNCPKNLSENLMIVDLLRNDLGRISEYGSVRVKNLFKIEKYETLFQMTSLIESRLRPGISYYEIFKNIFPSGSVTGAPKIRTMEIIRELEKEPRKIYTGAIGFISPGRKAVFNVAIRTILLDLKNSRAELGLGGGIVYDSKPLAEYAECQLKAKFLKSAAPNDFRLIETMRWEPKAGIRLFDLHLKRLKDSAAYFDFCFDEKFILKKVREKIKKLDKKNLWRVRLLLSSDGRVDLFTEKLEKIKEPMPIIFSKLKTNSEDIFFYHKTTQRRLYERELARARQAGYFDVIFTNQKNEVTEGAISNIFIKKNGRLWTPPISCGLLNGVFRQDLLGRRQVGEKVLYPEDLREAEEIFLTNAVLGVTKVKF